MTNDEKKTVRAFKTAFLNDSGELVLSKLGEFCGENRDIFVRDNERVNAYMQGRLSVIIEIKNIIKENENGENN